MEVLNNSHGARNAPLENAKGKIAIPLGNMNAVSFGFQIAEEGEPLQMLIWLTVSLTPYRDDGGKPLNHPVFPPGI